MDLIADTAGIDRSLMSKPFQNIYGDLKDDEMALVDRLSLLADPLFAYRPQKAQHKPQLVRYQT